MIVKNFASHGVFSWSPVQKYKSTFATGAKGDKPYLRIIDRLGYSVLGATQSPTGFESLAWSTFGPTDMGVIAGGMEDGAVTLWDPSQIIGEDEANIQLGVGCLSAQNV